MTSKINEKRIGEFIKELRVQTGQTQLETSLRLGYSEKQYRRIEKNGSDKITVLQSIADFYKVDVLSVLNAGLESDECSDGGSSSVF